MSSSLERNHNYRSTKKHRQNKQNGYQNKNEVHALVFLHFSNILSPHLSFLQGSCALKAVCCFGFKVTQAEAGAQPERKTPKRVATFTKPKYPVLLTVGNPNCSIRDPVVPPSPI
jgi:hypothetical protein